MFDRYRELLRVQNEINVYRVGKMCFHEGEGKEELEAAGGDQLYKIQAGPATLTLTENQVSWLIDALPLAKQGIVWTTNGFEHRG